VSGWSGQSGTSGQTGWTGISGQTGWSGWTGWTGHTGWSGWSGPSGPIGTFGINFVIDGGGSVIATGTKGYVVIPFNCTVISWTIVADQSGSIVVDVHRSTYAGFPTTTTIAGSELPTLSAVQKNEDLSLSTWTTTLSAGDILEFIVDGTPTSVTRVVVELTVTRP
jgi:hypothetical protein